MTAFQIKSYLSLLFLECLPNSQFSILLKKFNTIAAIAAAKYNELVSLGLTPTQALSVKETLARIEPLSAKIEQSLNWEGCSSENHLVCFEENYYPRLLRKIDCPPPILFLSGRPSALILPQLAIVGSRNASYQGKQVAYWLAKELSTLGFGICSGLAAGIDTQAHLGVVSGTSSTVAVMGTGADIIYPSSNRKLASQIQSHGALVSEFALGSPPIASHFPRRNRIISGMSLGVVVVEAALKSGSLITARLAMEQNREVFAVPGSIQNPLAKGCHQLIKDGAKLVDSIDSVVEEITSLLSFQLQNTKLEIDAFGEFEATTESGGLSDDENTVLQILGYGECPLDTLVSKTNKKTQSISSILTGLELKGLVEQESGRFKRITSGLQEASD